MSCWLKLQTTVKLCCCETNAFPLDDFLNCELSFNGSHLGGVKHNGGVTLMTMMSMTMIFGNMYGSLGTLSTLKNREMWEFL